MTAIALKWVPTDTDRVTLSRTKVDIKLIVPDLGGFPTPVEKARVLLTAAAQVEHMLLVQYLYAAMTLKSGPELAKLTGHQQEQVRSWRTTLLGIAIEEMGHLMSVQNLRLFVGFAPTFDRERFPSPVDRLYPFRLELEPLTQRSLSKYILAEAPTSDEAKLGRYRKAAGATQVRHVGVIYALLSILFSATDFVRRPRPDRWDRFVLAVANARPQDGGLPPAHDATRWHLEPGDLDAESLVRQADSTNFPTPHVGFFFQRVGGTSDARELVRRIGLQGEAPVDQEGEPSHYQRFVWMAEGHGRMPPFPAKNLWVPSMPVLKHPRVGDYPSAARKTAHEFDKAYAGMLRALKKYFHLTNAKRRGAAVELEEWMRELRRIGKDLVQLPARARRRVASPLFTLP